MALVTRPVRPTSPGTSAALAANGAGADHVHISLSQVKPHRCGYCGQRFSDRSMFRTHCKLHSAALEQASMVAKDVTLGLTAQASAAPVYTHPRASSPTATSSSSSSQQQPSTVHAAYSPAFSTSLTPAAPAAAPSAVSLLSPTSARATIASVARISPMPSHTHTGLPPAMLTAATPPPSSSPSPSPSPLTMLQHTIAMANKSVPLPAQPVASVDGTSTVPPAMATPAAAPVVTGLSGNLLAMLATAPLQPHQLEQALAAARAAGLS
jgi:hypothetical protein